VRIIPFSGLRKGEGLGIVVRVGDNTMIGSIATLATATKEEKSTLEVRGPKKRCQRWCHHHPSRTDLKS